MQNSLSKEGNVLEFTSKTNEAVKGISVPGELTGRTNIAVVDVSNDSCAESQCANEVCVIKKDGTKQIPSF